MRFLTTILGVLAAVLVSACDLWPKELTPLAESVARQVHGETTAWLVGGDVVLIDVAGSPAYGKAQPELEALAVDIAEQAIGFAAGPLESIAVTFHEGEVSEDPEKMREFIFLVTENRPVLQPNLDFDATGPLTVGEIQSQIIDRMDESLITERRQCILGEVEKLARAAGDPETLDPASLDYLPGQSWEALDPFGRRLVLAQAMTTKALFDCVRPANG